MIHTAITGIALHINRDYIQKHAHTLRVQYIQLPYTHAANRSHEAAVQPELSRRARPTVYCRDVGERKQDPRHPMDGNSGRPLTRARAAWPPQRKDCGHQHRSHGSGSRCSSYNGCHPLHRHIARTVAHRCHQCAHEVGSGDSATIETTKVLLCVYWRLLCISRL